MVRKKNHACGVLFWCMIYQLRDTTTPGSIPSYQEVKMTPSSDHLKKDLLLWHWHIPAHLKAVMLPQCRWMGTDTKPTLNPTKIWTHPKQIETVNASPARKPVSGYQSCNIKYSICFSSSSMMRHNEMFNQKVTNFWTLNLLLRRAVLTRGKLKAPSPSS